MPNFTFEIEFQPQKFGLYKIILQNYVYEQNYKYVAQR